MQGHLFYEFGQFSLDPSRKLLWRAGILVPLTPKALETLVVLVRGAGAVVEKQELISAVWPDSFVEEGSLTFNISVLRKALGNGDATPAAPSQPYIETVPKRGYRFTAPVRARHHHHHANEDRNDAEITPETKHHAASPKRAATAAAAAVAPEAQAAPTPLTDETAAPPLASARRAPVMAASVVLFCCALVASAFVLYLRPWMRSPTPMAQGGVGVTTAAAPSVIKGRAPIDREAARLLYLKGRYIWNKRTWAGNQQSIELFQEAISRDPGDARAYAGLADAYAFERQEFWPQAEAAARKSIALDPALADPHASLGFIKMFHHWDWAGAEQEFQIALALDPRYATAHHWRAVSLELTGRFDEAEAEMQQALALEPLSLIFNTDLAEIYYYARRNQPALAQTQTTLELDGGFGPALDLRARINGRNGDFRSETPASAVVGAGTSPLPLLNVNGCISVSPASETSLRDAYTTARCPELLRAQIKADANDPVRGAWGLAMIYASLGDNDRAFEWLEKAYAVHHFSLAFIKVEPAFDALHADPRFRELLRRMNFPGAAKDE